MVPSAIIKLWIFASNSLKRKGLPTLFSCKYFGIRWFVFFLLGFAKFVLVSLFKLNSQTKLSLTYGSCWLNLLTAAAISFSVEYFPNIYQSLSVHFIYILPLVSLCTCYSTTSNSIAPSNVSKWPLNYLNKLSKKYCGFITYEFQIVNYELWVTILRK